MMNFPSGIIHYSLRVAMYHQTRTQHTLPITFEQTETEFELLCSESNNSEIDVSESKSLIFLLRNPTSFPTNFTLDGSLKWMNGFEIGNNSLPYSVVIYPQESIQIEITINSGTAVIGSTNTIILHATNGCVDLYSFKNVTVIEQVGQITINVMHNDLYMMYVAILLSLIHI